MEEINIILDKIEQKIVDISLLLNVNPGANTGANTDIILYGFYNNKTLNNKLLFEHYKHFNLDMIQTINKKQIIINSIFRINKYANKLIMDDDINNINELKPNDAIYLNFYFPGNVIYSSTPVIGEHYTLNNFIQTKNYKEKVRLKHINNSFFRNLTENFQGIINVNGDGKCYYRAVLYGLLISVLYLVDIPNMEDVNKLRNFFENHIFFNEIFNRYGQLIPYINFIIVYSKYDSELITICKKKILDKILLMKNNINKESLNKCCEILQSDTRYANNEIIAFGILPALLGCKKSFIYNNYKLNTSEIEELYTENNRLPFNNIIKIGDHYQILVKKK